MKSYKKKTSTRNSWLRFLSLILTIVILGNSVDFSRIFATENSRGSMATPAEAISINNEDTELGDGEVSSEVEFRERSGESNTEEFADALEEDGFKYVVANDEVMIVGLAEGNNATEINIPAQLAGKTVTSIAHHAFYFKDLTAITLSENIKNIGEYAFSGNQLTEVVFPDSLISIGQDAFRDNLIETLELKNVTTVGEGAFANNKITTLDLGNAVESLGDSAFSNNKLTQVSVPETLTSVGADVFSYNGRFVNVISNAQPLNIPAIQKTEGGYGYVVNPVIINVKYLDNETGAKLLDDAVLGDDFTSDRDIFAKGTEQTYIPPTIEGYEPVLSEGQNGIVFTPDENGYILEVRYRKKTSGLVLRQDTAKKAMLPVNATNVDELLRSFIIATNAAGDDLKASVEIEPSDIDTSVEGTTHEVRYTLRDEFGEVKRLTLQVYVGTDMNNFPLGNNWVLGDFVYGGRGNNYDSNPNRVLGFSDQGLAKLANNKELILPHINPVTGDRITYVYGYYGKDNYKYSFRNKGLTSITDFDKNITEIGGEAFRDNNALTSVRLENLETIRYSAFQYTRALTDFDFSKVKRIENNVFYSSGIKSLIAPNLTYLGSYAFYDSKIGSDPDYPQGIYLPELENANVYGYAFYKNKLTYIDKETQFPKLSVLPDGIFRENLIKDIRLPGIEQIGHTAFYYQGNRPVNSLYAPDVVRINNNAFGYNQMTEIDLPSVEFLGSDAFRDNNFTSVNLPRLAEVQNHAFYNNKIAELNVPLLSKIGNFAFERNLLESINLPSATTLGQAAFQYNKLREAHLPVLESLGVSVFNNDDNRQYNPGLDALGGFIPVYTNNTTIESKENYIINPEDGVAGEYTDDDFTWDTANPNRVTGLTTKGKAKFISNDFVLKFTDRAQIVAAHAFRMEKIKQVTGNAVVTIEPYAFYRNPLNKADFPIVNSIGDYAFSTNNAPSTNKLKRFDFTNVTTLGHGAFDYAGLEGKLSIPELITAGNHVFRGNLISDVSAPKLTKISYEMFSTNRIMRLTGEMFPVAEQIETYAFQSNPLVGTIDLPSVKRYGGYREFNRSNKDGTNPLILILGPEGKASNNDGARISAETFDTASIPGNEHYGFRYAPDAIILTAHPNPDGTLDRTNPNGIRDHMHSASGYYNGRWIPTKYRRGIVNPSTLKVNYRLITGEALDGQDGRPRLSDFREYIYEEQLPRNQATGEFAPAKTYKAPQLDGYILVSSTDAAGVTTAKKATVDVPFEADGQKTDREITFTYKKIEKSNITGPRLQYGISGNGNSIAGQSSEYVVSRPSIGQLMPQMLTSFSIEEVRLPIKKGKIKITFDSPYIDPQYTVLAASDATRNWYRDDAMVATDTGLEITLNPNISAGDALRGARISYRYKSNITPDQTTTRMKMVLVDEDDNGNEVVISEAEPVDLTLVYKPTPSITANSPLNISGYNYSGYNDASGGPRNMGDLVENPAGEGYKVVENPDYTKFYYTVNDVYYLMDQVTLTTELPKYTAINENGVEEERTAVFEPGTNSNWTLASDGKTLTTTKEFLPTRDAGVINRYLPPLYLKFPGIKEKTNVVNKVYSTLRPYRDPRDGRTNANVVATGDLGVGDSLTIYPLYVKPKPFVYGDRAMGKSHTYTPRSLNGNAYLYDNLEDKEKEINFNLYVSSTNELEDYKNVSIIDYGLDSRLVYKAIRFNQTPNTVDNMNVLILGYRKTGEKINPDADTVVFEREAPIDSTKAVGFSDAAMDYIQIKLLGTDEKPLNKSLSFTVVTKVKDPSQPIFDSTQNGPGNVLVNKAYFLGDVYKKGTDEIISRKPTNPEYENINSTSIVNSQANVNILEYKVNMGVKKSLASFDPATLESYKRYPSLESGEVVLEGESGAYHIMLNSELEGNPKDRGNAILNNLEIIDVLPEAIETQLSDIKLHPLFIKARGKVEIIDNYQVVENGETVSRRALRFYSERFDTRVYGNSPLYVASINTKYTGNTIRSVLTNRVYSKWDNPDVTKLTPATTSDKTAFVDPHGNAGQDIWSYDEASIKVTSSSALTGRLYIRNRDDMIWQDSTFTGSNKPFDYKMVVSNYDNSENSSPYEAIDIINIIPGLEDYKLNKQGLRGTEFENTVDLSRIATDLVLPEGYSIRYLNTDTSVHDLLDNGKTVDDLAVDPTMIWSSTPASNTKAFRITADPGVKLDKGKKIEIILPMLAPRLSGLEDPIIGKRAVDSFALRYYVNGSTTQYIKFAEVNSVFNYMEAPKGSITFKKFGKLGNLAADSTATVLEGAGFELIDRSTEEVIKAAYSDENGVVRFDDLDVTKNYRIREFLPPETYVVSRNNQYYFGKNEFKNAANNNFNIELDDNRSKNQFMNVKAIEGKIKIIKKTRDNIQNIPNISFRMRGIDFTNNTINTEVTTGEDGTVTIERLPEGRYTISEIESTAINRYQKAPDQTVTIDVNRQDIEVTFVNDKFQVLFRKIITNDEADMDPANWDQLTDFGKKKVAGYKFKVVGEDGTSFTTGTTGNDGTVILQNLKTDIVYTVTELPPNQLSGNLKDLYTHNDREYKFKISHEGRLINAANDMRFKQFALNIPNMPKDIKGKVTVTKTDDASPANNLENAKISINKVEFDRTGNIASSTLISEQITNNSGIVIFDELEPGTYHIKELEPPAGYLLNTNVIEVTIPKNVIDSMATDNNYDKSTETIKYSTSRTLVNKKSSVKGIKGSDIEGYKNVSVSEAEIYINANRQEMPNLTYRSTGRNIVTVYNPLENVVFELYKMENGQKSGPAIEIDGSTDLLTNNRGEINFGSYKFEYNTEYALVEKSTIDGYERFEGIKTFRISDEAAKPGFRGELSFYLNNIKEEGSVLISKYDGFNRASLSGAVFEIYAGDLANADFNRPLKTITTKYDGYALFDKLPFGTYVVREKSAPEGYKVPDAATRDKEVTISRDSRNARLIIFNKQLIDIPVTKVWAESSEANAKIRLLRSISKTTGFTPVIVNNFTDGAGNLTLSANADENLNWKATYAGLDRTDDNGNKYYYKVEEVDVPRSLYSTTISGTDVTGFTVTNTDTPENKVSVSVTKEWSFALDGEIPEGASIQVALQKVINGDINNPLAGNNVEQKQVVTLNADNNWQHTFTNLKKKENGRDIVYRVVELNSPEGFVTTNSYDRDNNNFTISNAAVKRSRIRVVKNWQGVRAADAPRIAIELYDAQVANQANATPIASQEVNQDNNYTAEFTDIPSYAYSVGTNGTIQARKIKYVLKEKYLDGRTRIGYTSTNNMDDVKFAEYTADGEMASNIDATITNTMATQNIILLKQWVGVEAANAPAVQYKIIDVTADTTDDMSDTVNHIEIGSAITLDNTNNWTQTVENLPRYKADGITEIKYAIKELNPKAGYVFTQSTNRGADNNITITGTNTRVKRNLSLKKEWDDVSTLFTGSEETKPSVNVHIYADNTGAANYTVSATDEIAGSPFTIEAGADNSWTRRIENLDKYADDGVTEIKYYAVEDEVAGYTSNATINSPRLLQVLNNPGSTQNSDELKATIVNTRERVNIQVVKTWLGLEKYPQNIRANIPSVHMDLYAKKPNEDAVLVSNRVSALTHDANDDDNVWKANFINLPKYDIDGNLLEYSIVEREAAGLKGYISEVSVLPADLQENNTVNVTNTVKTRAIKATKVWVGKQENQVNVHLLKNGTRISQQPTVITANTNSGASAWSYAFENLPYYDIDGVTPIEYTLEEDAIAGYESNIITTNTPIAQGSDESSIEFTVTNTYKTVDINIRKEWRGVNVNSAPEVVLQLTDNTDGNNTPIANKTVTLNAANSFRATLEDLPKFKADGTTRIIYGLIEQTQLNGYTFSYTESHSDEAQENSAYGTVSLSAVNTRVNQPISLFKAYAADDSGYERPEVVFRLWADSTNDNLDNPVAIEPLDGIRLNNANRWQAHIDNLPKYAADGVTLIKYYVSEDAVAGYTTPTDKTLLVLRDDFLAAELVNSLKLRNVKVTKQWEGLDKYKQNVRDSIPAISVKLFDKTDNANPIELDTKTLTDNAGAWEAEFENLPVYKADGTTEIIYDIEEVEADTLLGYVSNITNNRAVAGIGDLEFNITNTVKTAPINISKSWIGVDAAQAPEIRLTLVDNTATANKDVIVAGKEVVLNTTNNWQDTIEDMPLYQIDGVTPVVYGVSEEELDGYTFSFRVQKAADESSITIQASNTRKLRNITLNKTWSDDLSGYERPEVRFVLWKNDVDNNADNAVATKPLLNNQEVDAIVLNRANSFTVSYQVPKFAPDGTTEVRYFVSEEQVNGYVSDLGNTSKRRLEAAQDGSLTATIDNSLIVRDIRVEKDWQGLDLYKSTALESLPEIHVELYDATDANNKIRVRERKKLVKDQASGKWIANYIELPKFKQDGVTEIIYEIKEVEEDSLIGYTATYETPVVDNQTDNILLGITNTVKTIDINAVKNWVGVDPAQAPEIVLGLVDSTANNKTVDLTNKTLRLNNNNNWSGSFGNLPLYQIDGKTQINYTLEEQTTRRGYTFSQIKAQNNIEISLTATNTRVLRDIHLQKTWKTDLSGYQRPEVVFKLYRNNNGARQEITHKADGSELGEIRLSSANNWQSNISGLPRYDEVGDDEIEYFVREEAVAGYKQTGEVALTLDGDAQTGRLTATIQNELLEKAVNITKEWSGLDLYEEEQRAKISDIYVQLLDKTDEDNIILVRTPVKVEKSTAGVWSASFERLPVYKQDGTTYIVYTVEEVDVDERPGYLAETRIQDSLDSTDITLTNTIQTVPFITKKEWVGVDMLTAPDAVFALESDAGVELTGRTLRLNNANNWEASFGDLPLYASDGKTKINYTVREVETHAGYEFTQKSEFINNSMVITGTNTRVKRPIKVKKVWADDTSGYTRPAIELDLLRSINSGNKERVSFEVDGNILDKIVLSSDNNWEAKITGLDKYDIGGDNEYTYYVEERTVNGYHTPSEALRLELSTDEELAKADTLETTVNNSLIVRNIKVEKEWLGLEAYGDDIIPRLPNITAMLYDITDEANPILVESKRINRNSTNVWSVEFKDKPKFKADGLTEIVYTVKEAEAEELTGYITSYEDLTVDNEGNIVSKIVNKLRTRNIVVNKKWKGPFAPEIEVSLYADGVFLADKVIRLTSDDSNAWTYTYSGMPYYDVDGKTVIEYTVSEKPISNYKVKITAHEIVVDAQDEIYKDLGFEIENTYEDPDVGITTIGKKEKEKKEKPEPKKEKGPGISKEEPPTTPQEISNETEGDSKKRNPLLPKTGDASNIIAYLLVLLASALGFIFLVFKKRRKNK